MCILFEWKVCLHMQPLRCCACSKAVPAFDHYIHLLPALAKTCVHCISTGVLPWTCPAVLQLAEARVFMVFLQHGRLATTEDVPMADREE